MPPKNQAKNTLRNMDAEAKQVSVIIEAQPLQRLVKWENGVPVATSERVPLKKEDISVILGQALVAPFDKDPAYERAEDGNLTNLEVMAHSLARAAAFGDIKAVEVILDRILGKPKQQTENINMRMSYQDFLDSINKNENERECKDVTPINPCAEGDTPEAFN